MNNQQYQSKCQYCKKTKKNDNTLCQMHHKSCSTINNKIWFWRDFVPLGVNQPMFLCIKQCASNGRLRSTINYVYSTRGGGILSYHAKYFGVFIRRLKSDTRLLNVDNDGNRKDYHANSTENAMSTDTEKDYWTEYKNWQTQPAC